MQILAGTQSLCSVAIIMDILNDPNLDYLPDLNKDKPPELIEFEHQVHKANDHFCAIRNDIIRWYLSPPKSHSYPKLAKKNKCTFRQSVVRYSYNNAKNILNKRHICHDKIGKNNFVLC